LFYTGSGLTKALFGMCQEFQTVLKIYSSFVRSFSKMFRIRIAQEKDALNIMIFVQKQHCNY